MPRGQLVSNWLVGLGRVVGAAWTCLSCCIVVNHGGVVRPRVLPVLENAGWVAGSLRVL